MGKRIYIHKEGYGLICFFAVFFAVIVGVCASFLSVYVSLVLGFLAFLFWGFVVCFFRMPVRAKVLYPQGLLCPADGEVVIVEKVFEPEYFKKECLQISIFMSPLNVHVNRYPMAGVVDYFKYHPGKYLVAWHPKSSTLNERTSVVIKDKQGRRVLERQIAGAVARRIVCYAQEGKTVTQGEEVGFIKFGSRVDLFIENDFDVAVSLKQKVKGGVDFIGSWK